MSNKTFLLFSFFISFSTFFFNFHTASADVVINEIMYNPSGDDVKREWVEFFNNGTENVTIISGSSGSAWRFDDGAASLHIINDQIVIPPGGYAILASDKTTFISENTNFSGLVADTTMSLSNNGLLKLWNGDNPRLSIASQSYNSSSGADNDGNSLQLINNSWVAAVPTPGLLNQADNNNQNPSNTNNGNTVTYGTGLVNQKSSEQNTYSSSVDKEPKIKATIIANSVSFADLPIDLKGSALGYSGEKLHSGKYFWNFGDGSSMETLESTNNAGLSHTYSYPGDYMVSMEYYLYTNSETPSAVNKIKIKVVPLAFSISSMGDQNDFFVELTNNSDYDIDASGWSILSDKKSFTFPKNTNILAKSKIVLSP